MGRPPLAGSGLLAIWNGMVEGQDAAFLRWHMSEHIPERLSVPGFLRARRYRAVEASPAYFNFYEVERPEVLDSAPYLERLNNPSDWTRRVVPHFTDTSRILCRVIASRGAGIGGFVIAVRFDAEAEAVQDLLDPLLNSPDICAVHLLGRYEKPAAATNESAMRGAPDGTSSALLIVEGLSPDLLAAAVDACASDKAIADLTGVAPTARGLYQLDFLMTRADVAQT
jgi:hypothetical protein